MVGSRLIALTLRVVRIGARLAGADRAVRVRSQAAGAAQDGIAGAVAGRAVSDGGHIWLPEGDGSRTDGAADGATGNWTARWLAGTGYVVSSRGTSWLADGRCRGPRTAGERLAGGRWAGSGLTADRTAAFDYVAGRLT